MNIKSDHVSELCRNIFEIRFKFSSEMKKLFIYDKDGVHFTNEEVPRLTCNRCIKATSIK